VPEADETGPCAGWSAAEANGHTEAWRRARNALLPRSSSSSSCSARNVPKSAAARRALARAAAKSRRAEQPHIGTNVALERDAAIAMVAIGRFTTNTHCKLASSMITPPRWARRLTPRAPAARARRAPGRLLRSSAPRDERESDRHHRGSRPGLQYPERDQLPGSRPHAQARAGTEEPDRRVHAGLEPQRSAAHPDQAQDRLARRGATRGRPALRPNAVARHRRQSTPTIGSRAGSRDPRQSRVAGHLPR
jgi:hypothetical protein